MSKTSKLLFIVGILFMILSYNCIVFAETSTTSLSTNQTTSNTTTTTQTSSTNTKATTTKSTSNSAQYSTAVSASNFDLQLTNILSICLIVVGVLLILLSIAILIRLKG